MKLRILALTAENIIATPAASGVLELLDGTGHVVEIVGVPNLRQALREQLTSSRVVHYFRTEKTSMYAMRENELLRSHIRRHGQPPPRNTPS